MSSNQKEADTKLLLHANHTVLLHPDGSIIVRSPSGDVDINVLFICMFLEKAEQIYIDYGTGKSRKILKLGSVDMSDELKSALIGFHAFTGNDYVSSFFEKSKKHCWHLQEKITDLFGCLQLLEIYGSPVMIYLMLLKKLCVTCLEGSKNSVHYDIFKAVYTKKGKIQDLSILPPSLQSLQLQCKRANYIAKIWRSCLNRNIDFQNVENSGWRGDGTFVWIEEAFPDQIESIIADTDESKMDEADVEDSSDSKDEDIA